MKLLKFERSIERFFERFFTEFKGITVYLISLLVLLGVALAGIILFQ